MVGEQGPGKRPDQTRLEGGEPSAPPLLSLAAVAYLFKDGVTSSTEGDTSLFLSNPPGDTVQGLCLTALRKEQPGSFIT